MSLEESSHPIDGIHRNTGPKNISNKIFPCTNSAETQNVTRRALLWHRRELKKRSEGRVPFLVSLPQESSKRLLMRFAFEVRFHIVASIDEPLGVAE